MAENVSTVVNETGSDADLAAVNKIENMLFGKDEPEEQEQQQQEAPVEQEAAPEEQPAEEIPTTYEFEWNGAKYQVPPELKELHEGYLRTQDYTKKTQEVAEARRSADAVIQQAKLAQALSTAAKDQREQLAALRAAERHFQTIDWNSLATENPIEAQKQFMAHSQIKDAISKTQAEIKEAEGKAFVELQAAQAKILEEANQVLSKEIKGWGPEKAQKLNSFAQQTYGFSAQELSNISDARVVKMLNDALQWRELQQSKPQVQNKAVQVSKTLKPNASDQKNPGLEKAAYLKSLKGAKTDAERSRLIQAHLESRIV